MTANVPRTVPGKDALNKINAALPKFQHESKPLKAIVISKQTRLYEITKHPEWLAIRLQEMNKFTAYGIGKIKAKDTDFDKNEYIYDIILSDKQAAPEFIRALEDSGNEHVIPEITACAAATDASDGKVINADTLLAAASSNNVPAMAAPKGAHESPSPAGIRKCARPFHIYEPPNSTFTNRATTISEIIEAIKACKDKENRWERIIVIRGSSGMGKTTIAQAVAHEYVTKYDKQAYVGWFTADSETSIIDSFKSLVNLVKGTKIKFESCKDCSNIYHYLSVNYKFGIFFFDDAIRLKKCESKNLFGIFDFLPKDNLLKHPIIIAITSRDTEYWSDVNKIITVPKMREDEAEKCILNYFGLNDEIITKELQENIRQLGKDVRYFPMEIKLIATAIANYVNHANFFPVHLVDEYTNFWTQDSFKELCSNMEISGSRKCIYEDAIERIRTGLELYAKPALHIMMILVFVDFECKIPLGCVYGIYSKGENQKLLEQERNNNVKWSNNMEFRGGLKLLDDCSLITLDKSLGSYDRILIYLPNVVKRNCLKKLLSDKNTAVDILKRIKKYYIRASAWKISGMALRGLFNLIKSDNFIITEQIQDFGIFLHCYLCLSRPQPGNASALFEERYKFLQNQNLDDHDTVLLKLSQTFYPPLTNQLEFVPEGTELLALLTKLKKDFWILRFCTELLFHASVTTNRKTRFQKSTLIDNTSELCEWIIEAWLECEETNTPYCNVLKLLWRLGGQNAFGNEIIPKILRMSDEEIRIDLWTWLHGKIKRYHLTPDAVTSRMLVESIKFSSSTCQTDFLCDSLYLDLLKNAIVTSEMCHKLCEENFCRKFGKAVALMFKNCIEPNLTEMWRKAEKGFKAMKILFILVKRNNCSCLLKFEELLEQNWKQLLQAIESTNLPENFAQTKFWKPEQLSTDFNIRTSDWSKAVKEYYAIIGKKIEMMTNVGEPSGIDSNNGVEADCDNIATILEQASTNSKKLRDRWVQKTSFIKSAISFSNAIIHRCSPDSMLSMWAFWYNLLHHVPRLRLQERTQIDDLQTFAEKALALQQVDHVEHYYQVPHKLKSD